MRYVNLNPLLEEREKEERIIRLPSPTGEEMIAIRNR